jgi:hypothetical protein
MCGERPDVLSKPARIYACAPGMNPDEAIAISLLVVSSTGTSDRRVFSDTGLLQSGTRSGAESLTDACGLW